MVESFGADRIIEAQGGGTHGYGPHVLATFWHVAGGVVPGIVLGIGAALVAVQTRASLVASNTSLELIRTLPPLIFVPFASIIFGTSDLVELVSVGLYATLTIMLYSLNALNNIHQDYLMLSHLLGAGPYRRAVTVQLPAIVPELLGAVRLVFAFGLGIAIVVEYLASPTGIGRVMKYSLAFSKIDLVVVGVLWTIMLAFAFDVVIVLTFGALFKWTERRQLLESLASN